MKPMTSLFAAVAALSVISTVVEGADGCGRGWYYNGRRCVPQDEPGYGPQYRGYYGPPSTGATTGRPDHKFELVQTKMSRDTPRRIRPSKRGTTARRTSRCRMGC